MSEDSAESSAPTIEDLVIDSPPLKTDLTYLEILI